MRDKIKALVPKNLPNPLKKEEEAPSESAPRITNETVAEHREEVLSSARKYIYPLQHSKRRIVIVSTSLFIAVFITFISYCLLALYRFQTSSSFIYGVSQVVPFPIAKAGPSYVAYENYLFELRHYIHYYQTQQHIDFTTDSGKQQLADFKKRALNKVIDDAYVKQLAHAHKLNVTDQEANNQITIVRNENRLGASDKAFADVLKDYWGWSVDDFKRSLRTQLLSQKVVSALDTGAHTRAKAGLGELKNGHDFGDIAKQFSEDAGTKGNGGEYGFLIDPTNRDVPPQVVEALYKLKPGEYSDIINTGDGLEIVKNIETQGDKIRAAHMVFNFKPLSTYTDPLKAKAKAHQYITLK